MVFAKSNQLISASEKHHSPVYTYLVWICNWWNICIVFISLLSLPFSNKFTHLPSQAFDHQVHRPKVSLGQHTNAHHYLCHQLSHHNSVQHSDTAVSLMQCDYNISKLALTLPLNYLFLDEQERFLQRTAYRRGSPTTRSSCAQPFFMST